MGTYEDRNTVKDYILNMSHNGYFRITYVYVDGEFGHFDIIVELYKLPGWEGYYDDSTYRNELEKLKDKIRYDVVYTLGFHWPRVRFRLKDY